MNYNNKICVLKLVSGELIFALVESEDDDSYVVEFPISVDELTKDAWEFNTFSEEDDKIYTFKKTHIIYIKTLSPFFKDKYKSILEDVNSKNNSNSGEELELEVSKTIQ